MAITDAYASVDEYKARYPDTLGTSQLKECLEAVSRLFERETGQFFGVNAEVVARTFYAKYSDLLDLTYSGRVPGIATTTGLEIKVDTDHDGSFADETAWAATDYQLFPLDADKGPEPEPWDRISVPRWSTKTFIPGGLVQVTAKFGRLVVPAAVRQDTIELTAIWLSNSPRATGRINELDVVVQASPMAMSLVSRFRDAYRGKVTL